MHHPSAQRVAAFLDSLYLDISIIEFDEVWAAAGTSRAVFSIDPHILARATDGQAAELGQ